MVAAFGLTGLAGAVGGVDADASPPAGRAADAGRRWSHVAVWFAGLFVTPRLRDLLSTDRHRRRAVVVVALVWTIYWFARHSRQRGWLR